MNLLTHNMEDAKICRDDTLRDSKFANDHDKLAQFDLLVLIRFSTWWS